MEFPFLEVLARRERRPIVPFTFTSLPNSTYFGLIDSGALGVRCSSDIAPLLGINLDDIKQEDLHIGGAVRSARTATVEIQVGRVPWDAPVTFLDNWNESYQILGIRGFFTRWVVRVDASAEQVRLSPSKSWLASSL